MNDYDLQVAINAAYDQVLVQTKSRWRLGDWLRSTSIDHEDSAQQHLVALRGVQLRRAIEAVDPHEGLEGAIL